MVAERVGELLSGNGPETLELLQGFLTCLDWHGQGLLTCLRQFLSLLKLPGGAERIDRLIHAFAESFVTLGGCSEDEDGMLVDTAYVLCFSLIMLNTDLHNVHVRHMTEDEFVRPNRGINNGADLPTHLLCGYYQELLAEEIRALHSETEVAAGQTSHASGSPSDAGGASPQPCSLQ